MRISVEIKPSQGLVPTPIMFQTAWWSDVKSRLGCTSLAVDYGSSTVTGDLLVVTSRIAEKVCMAHVPYGPEWGPAADQRGPFLEALSAALRPHLDPSVAFIRYDLPWDSQFANDPNWCDADGLRRPEPRIAEMRMNWGTESWALRKAPTDMLVPDTAILDLTSDEEELLARMKPKTRYNIHLAQRQGVRVELADIDRLPEFYELYRATAARQRFYAHRYEHFVALFTTPRTGPDAPTLLFLLARHEHDVLAGAVFSLCRGRATYLFGASAYEKRHLMAPYAVQWSAIQIARARGCTSYDLYGVAPTLDSMHPLAGVRRFKSGFGGEIVHRAGSWDFPLDPDTYEQFRAYESTGLSD